MALIVPPSRKPEFWAAVERHKKAEGKKKHEPVEAVPVKAAAKKKARGK